MSAGSTPVISRWARNRRPIECFHTHRPSGRCRRLRVRLSARNDLRNGEYFAISPAASSSDANDSWALRNSTIRRTPSGSTRWPMSIRTMPATSAGCRAASVIAVMPPSDAPTITARSNPNAPITGGTDAASS